MEITEYNNIEKRIERGLYSWPVAAFLFFAAIMLLALGKDTSSSTFFGAVLFYIYAVIYGLLDIRSRFGYIVFVFLIFVFLLSRITFAMIYDLDWSYWSEGVLKEALLIILISTAGLFVSCRLHLFKKPECYLSDIDSSYSIKGLRVALILLLILTGIAQAYYVGKYYLILRDYSYLDVYTDTVTISVPVYISLLSNLFPFVLAFFLATMPSKRDSVIALVAYLVMGLPLFMLGNRSSLILRIVFVTIYFLIRNTIRPGEKKWITPKLKVLFFVVVIISVFFLGAFNYIRSDKAISEGSTMPIAADFFYKQGTSFDTVCQGIEYKERIEAIPGEPIYSLAPIIDGFSYSRLGRLLLGKEELSTSSNSIKVVEEGNSLAHRLSYVALGEKLYLEGRGRGSSYVLETYLDFGYAGVLIYSIIIGLFLSNLLLVFQRDNLFSNYVALCALMSIFLAPRSAATQFLQFIITPHFWFVAIIGTTILVILRKGYLRQHLTTQQL